MTADTQESVGHCERPGESSGAEDLDERGDDRDGRVVAGKNWAYVPMSMASNRRWRRNTRSPGLIRFASNHERVRSESEPRRGIDRRIDRGRNLDHRDSVKEQGRLPAEDGLRVGEGVRRDGGLEALGRRGFEPLGRRDVEAAPEAHELAGGESGPRVERRPVDLAEGAVDEVRQKVHAVDPDSRAVFRDHGSPPMWITLRSALAEELP